MATISKPKTWHPSVTTDRVIAAVKLYDTTTENPGICIECGEDTDGCEPDARSYTCDNCGKDQVFGAHELLLMVL